MIMFDMKISRKFQNVLLYVTLPRTFTEFSQ